MAEVRDTDLVNCPVCLELYEESGVHVPRILPCHHTLCERCIGGLLTHANRQQITRPECRKNHKAGNQQKRFPQNKYVITYIIKMKKLAEAEERVEKCSEHGNEAALFCRNNKCEAPICHTCLLTKHKSHDFSDIYEERIKRKNGLNEMAELTDQRLWIQKQRLTFALGEVERFNSLCVERLEATKMKVINAVADKFDELIRSAKVPAAGLVEEVNEFNGQLGVINQIKEDSGKFEKIGSICNKLEKVATIEGQLRVKMDMERKFDFVDYPGVKIEDIIKMCGELRVKHKTAGLHTLKDGLPIKKKYDSVSCLRVISDGSIMILGDGDGRRKLTKCTIKNGKVVCSATLTTLMEQTPTGIAECRLQGKNRLAMSYGDSMKIDFHALEEPMNIIFSHSLSPYNRPGLLFSKAMYHGRLFFEDTSKEPRQVKLLECSRSIKVHNRPRPEIKLMEPTCIEILHTQQQSIHEFCCLWHQSGYHLLVTSHLSQGLVAYNMKSGKIAWRIKEKVLGLEGNIVPQSIAADDEGHLFVSDINNDMVHKFSSDGIFLGSVYCNVGEARISWSTAAAALIVLYRRGHKWYLKVSDDK